MNQLLIKQVLHQEQVVDILIENGVFTQIAPHIPLPDVPAIEAKGMAILPPFLNGHTHAAMTLLRGYADDMPLFTWLNDYIWPMEDQLTQEDIYWGSKLAILEMIKSGTIFFNDMYWMEEETIRAVDEMGIKAAIGITFMSNMGEKKIKATFDKLGYYTKPGNLPPRVSVTVAPHAVYTVDEELFHSCIRYAKNKNLVLHTHLSETQQEVDNCLKQHGKRPVEWLNSLGGIDNNLVAAHAIHLSPTEIELLAEKEATLVHNPLSNMKLASGVFPSTELLEAKCHIALGTDGCSSNNNLDMREEMKAAALLAKCHYQRPELLPASLLYTMSNKMSDKAFRLNTGSIEIGKKADALLINLHNERMTPCHNLISNWLYSAETSIIDTVLCDGEIIMQHRKVKGEDEILERANQCIAHINSQRQ